MVAVSKLTRKYQTTVPQAVRELLDLDIGDQVLWDIEKGKVVLEKVTRLDLEYARALEKTLSEWGSKNDEDAYRGL